VLALFLDLLVFLGTAFVAFTANWQTRELCWGFWIASLLSGWVVITSAIVRTILHVTGFLPLPPQDLVDGSPLGGFRRQPKGRAQDLTTQLPLPWRAPFLVFVALLLGIFTAFHFTMFHAIHGALMSVFVSIEPYSLFGPNGYINADFGTILAHLLSVYGWMIALTLLARRGAILAGNPGYNMTVIYRTVVRMHIFILLSGFLGILVVLYGREAYDRTLLLTLVMLFYFPWHRFGGRKAPAVENPEP